MSEPHELARRALDAAERNRPAREADLLALLDQDAKHERNQRLIQLAHPTPEEKETDADDD